MTMTVAAMKAAPRQHGTSMREWDVEGGVGEVIRRLFGVNGKVGRGAAGRLRNIIPRLSSRARGTRVWRSSPSAGSALSLSKRLARLLRRCAPANEHTLFVIAKEPWRLRQSTENFRWIATSLRSSR